MNHPTSIRLLALLVGVAWFAGVQAQAGERKPNIIHIVSDELGYYELSCMGNPHLKTPNMDRMAAEGVRFTQALAGSAVCAPTRCCLMTGKHSGHTSVRTNGGGTPLRAGEETIASVLKRAGYATGGFGKWGCGGRGSTGVPEKHGFDLFFGYYDQVHAHSYYPAYLVRNSEELPLAGNQGGRSGQTYSHYVIVEEAMKFIRANQGPAVLLLPAGHAAARVVRHPGHRSGLGAVQGQGLARGSEALRRDGQHGGPPGGRDAWPCSRSWAWTRRRSSSSAATTAGPITSRPRTLRADSTARNVDPKTGVVFRGKKGNLYEGGLRIPLLVRWPGKIQPGRVSDLLWYFPDVLPTLAELAGVPPPKDIDGISIVPELLGEAAAGRKQAQHEFLYLGTGAGDGGAHGQLEGDPPAPEPRRGSFTT